MWRQRGTGLQQQLGVNSRVTGAFQFYYLCISILITGFFGRLISAAPDYFPRFLVIFLHVSVWRQRGTGLQQQLGANSRVTGAFQFYHLCISILITGFFGRLISAAPDYFPRGVSVGRPGWMCLALIPMPLAFFYLATGDSASLYVSTAIIGTCSGFIISTAVCTTPELFGTNSFGVNHNAVVANIPLGSLLFGYMAALIYDYSTRGNDIEKELGRRVLCMGVKCYNLTFMIWGCICLVGLILNCILLIRTQRLYKN